VHFDGVKKVRIVEPRGPLDVNDGKTRRRPIKKTSCKTVGRVALRVHLLGKKLVALTGCSSAL